MYVYKKLALLVREINFRSTSSIYDKKTSSLRNKIFYNPNYLFPVKLPTATVPLNKDLVTERSEESNSFSVISPLFPLSFYTFNNIYNNNENSSIEFSNKIISYDQIYSIYYI